MVLWAGQGHWRQGGFTYRDSLIRLVIDVPDTMKKIDVAAIEVARRG